MKTLGNVNNNHMNLFKGTATYYSKFRPTYPSSLVRYLIQKFSLDGTGQMLDIGCGTGQLTIRFSDWFERIVGLDAEPEMIEEARQISNENRTQNIDWLLGNLEEHTELHNQNFRLVTFAKSFHWMNREEILNRLYDMVPTGGVAIIDHYNPDKRLEPWQEILNEKIQKWYGENRRAGNTVYQHPKASHEEIVATSKFDLEVHKIPTYKLKWTTESIIGHIYSTSYGRKHFLGEHVASFENDLQQHLLEFNSNNEFMEDIDLTVILAIKK